MSKPVVLVTGANGEIGRSLLQTVAAHGGFDVITLDLTLPPDALRSLVVASYAGNIMDRYLLDQVAAHHEVDMVFHLAALLSARGERDPELAHQVNVEGTLNVLRMAQNQSARLGRPVRFIFPSSIAVYGLPSLEEKRRGRSRPRGAVERAHHDVRLQQAVLRAPRPLLHVPRAAARPWCPPARASTSDRSASRGSSRPTRRPRAARATSVPG